MSFSLEILEISVMMTRKNKASDQNRDFFADSFYTGVLQCT